MRRELGELFITGRKNLEKFASNIDFLQSERRKRLKEVLKEYKLKEYRKGEPKQLILNFIEKQKIISTRELSLILKRTTSIILSHLSELEKKGLVKRYGRKCCSGIFMV